MRIFFRLVIFSSICILVWFVHRTGLLQKSLDWVDSFGSLGPAIFIILYVLTAIFFVPSLVFTFSGGVLFGFWTGASLSLVGTGLGSLTAFLIGRYLARDFVTRRFSGNREFLKLAEMVREKGWKIVALARLSPIFPFSVGNYAFGVTKIPASHYLGASLLGTVPSTTLYTYLGVLLGDAALLGSTGRARTWPEWVFLVVGLIATVLLSYYLRRLAQKTLAK